MFDMEINVRSLPYSINDTIRHYKTDKLIDDLLPTYTAAICENLLEMRF